MDSALIPVVVAAVAAIFGFIGVVVGGIITGYFTNRGERIRGEKEAALDGAKRQDDRRLDRDKFERQTLVALQDAAGALARAATMAVRTGPHRVRNEITDAEMDARRLVSTLRSNVADEQIRTLAASLIDAAHTATNAADHSVAGQALIEMAAAEKRLSERAGDMILKTFRAN